MLTYCKCMLISELDQIQVELVLMPPLYKCLSGICVFPGMRASCLWPDSFALVYLHLMGSDKAREDPF